MKWSRKSIFAVCASGFLSVACQAPDTEYLDGNDEAQPYSDKAVRLLDAEMAAFDRNDGPGCAVALTNKGDILASKAYGMADLDHDIPLSTSSVFRIASVSKQFTAFSIRLLIEDGVVSFDDDIRAFIPELPEYDHVVTVRHLLEHSSGLPYYDDVGFPYEPNPDYIVEIEGDDSPYGNPIFMSDSQFLERVLKVESLHYPPGERYAYNNVGYFLLGKIVERSSGKHLRDFAKERIFDPLGMSDTFFNTQTFVPVKGRARPYYRLKDGRFVEWQTDLNWIGDGGMFTTVEDLAKWDANFYNNILGGGADLIADMTRPNVDLIYPDYFDLKGEEDGAALGLFITSTNFGLVNEHGGSWVGFRTHSERHVNSGYGIYMLCNTYEAAALMPDLPRKILETAVTEEF